MMARNTGADLTVLGLVGERGREVRDFLENSLGKKAASARWSWSPLPTSLRCCAFARRWPRPPWPSIFAAQGKNVLLVVDSLTRLAMAQREIGLAAGEPPTAKGYTPSCFTMLARLIERAGKFRRRQHHRLLHRADGRRRRTGSAGRTERAPCSMATSCSTASWRCAATIRRLPCSTASAASCRRFARPHLQKAHELRRLLAAYTASEDLIRIGAYQKGSDPTLDKALALIPELHRFLMQKPGEATSSPTAWQNCWHCRVEAMAFHFPLQAVFHFRQSVEHQQELRLRAANQQVARVRHLLDQIEDGIREASAHTRELGIGTTSAELRFALGARRASPARQGCRARTDTLQNLRDQQQKIFQQARREREIFESLRDQQLREYERKRRRREQRQLDDFFLLRQAYLRRG